MSDRAIEPSDRASTLPHVVIVGGGFGGLRLARRLRKEPLRVTLIDQHNYHTFVPLVYEVATAGLAPGDIAQPFRAILRNAPNVEFVLGRVERIDLQQRTVYTSEAAFAYDYVVIAMGTVPNSFGIDGVDEHALVLKELPHAGAIRNHILRNFERADALTDPAAQARLMTTVVVGGGPTGVETGGALAELKQHVLRRDYPRLDLSQARVILLEAGDELLPSFPARLRRKALEQLQALGVEVRLRTAVTRVTAHAAVLKDGSTIETANVIWVAGTRGSPLAETLGISLARDGRIPVTPQLEIIGAERAYAIGDTAHLAAADGRPYPMLAQVAMQQADVVAANIVGSTRGDAPRRFRYRDRGVMATIGRRRAVAHVLGLQFSGVLAWMLWLAVHLLAIVSLRSRALVLLNWIWNYIRYDRASRIVTEDESIVAEDAKRREDVRSGVAGGE
jgi:NADH dehydrogenase